METTPKPKIITSITIYSEKENKERIIEWAQAFKDLSFPRGVLQVCIVKGNSFSPRDKECNLLLLYPDWVYGKQQEHPSLKFLLKKDLTVEIDLYANSSGEFSLAELWCRERGLQIGIPVSIGDFGECYYPLLCKMNYQNVFDFLRKEAELESVPRVKKMNTG